MVGGEEPARQKERPGQRPGGRRPRCRLHVKTQHLREQATLGPLPPAPPLGSVDQQRTQVLASSPLEDLWDLAGRLLCLFWAVGTGWVPCQAGMSMGASLLPHHLLAICPGKPLPCSAAAARARDKWDRASWLDAAVSRAQASAFLLRSQTCEPRAPAPAA